jgi:uncharacterized protein YndB with AHSA1/START domain
MIDNSYTREIIISNTPSAAYRALTSEFDKWWTAGSRPVTEVGDEITFRFDTTYWTMRVIKLRPNEDIEFECIEAHHFHKGLPASILKEWEGTKLKWKIEQHGDNTIISFVHEGLNPSLYCYDICERGWDHYFVKSLKNYLMATIK